MREYLTKVGSDLTSGRWFRPLLRVCVSLTALGCWQEVHYVPSAQPDPPPSKPVVLQSEQPTEIRPAEEKPVEERPVEMTPTVDDLFAEEEGETASEAAEPAPALEPDPIAEEPELAPNPATAHAAWRLASQWSLAVGIYGKGFDADRYGTMWNAAEREAGPLGVTLPVLPAAASPDRAADAASLLVEAGGPELAAELGERHSPQHQALCELATKTHALLLVYTPESADVKPLTAAIRRAGANSELPSDLWMPLVGLLDIRAEFGDVKREVFRVHQDVEAYLAEQVGR